LKDLLKKTLLLQHKRSRIFINNNKTCLKEDISLPIFAEIQINPNLNLNLNPNLNLSPVVEGITAPEMSQELIPDILLKVVVVVAPTNLLIMIVTVMMAAIATIAVEEETIRVVTITALVATTVTTLKDLMPAEVVTAVDIATRVTATINKIIPMKDLNILLHVEETTEGIPEVMDDPNTLHTLPLHPLLTTTEGTIKVVTEVDITGAMVQEITIAPTIPHNANTEEAMCTSWKMLTQIIKED